MREIVWQVWATKVIKETDGTFTVDTPISLEKGFSCQTDAVEYAMTWGNKDAREAHKN